MSELRRGARRPGYTYDTRTTTWAYDATFPAFMTREERPSTSGGAALRVAEMQYDAEGNASPRTISGAKAGSAFSLSTVSTFNGAGQPLSIDPPGHGTADVTSFTYDPARGHLLPLTRTDPLVGATTYGYDPLNRRQSVTDPNGVTTETAYDALDRTTHGYDALDRVTSVTQPWAGAGGGTAVTRYAYDVQDHLVKVTDAENGVTSYLYSDRDLMTRQVSEVSGTTETRYDEHGELATETDARGITMTRTVDPLDRVTTMDYPGTSLDVSYTYDDPLVPFSKGRLTAITRDGAAVAYRYDRFGRTTQDGVLTIGYDANGNRTSVRFPRKAAGFTQTVTALSTFDYADREVALS